ncbi:MAG: SAM-dependent methyltransferase [Alphaproteobacteria bacterium]|nr:SAM-dependent methyltransferase [Alphaproteobacteria bacterium]MCB9930403.1 SAM-dependent methyltransferase [Alphaproteobacteria bacterium]
MTANPVEALARRVIEAQGPISLAALMRLANAGLPESYYQSQQPFGSGGDFVTAPEISQMFGELLALAIADQWQRMGAPLPVDVVELGPGRGVLMADALRTWQRAAPGFYAGLRVTMIEASPALSQAQAERLKGHGHRVAWQPDLPARAAPLFLLANEFFDALPIQQFLRVEDGWRERLIAWDDARGFHDALGPLVAAEGLPEGEVWEHSPDSLDWAARIGERLALQGGLALIVDYDNRPGQTSLRGISRHRRAAPLEGLGQVDLSAGVDFAALAAAAVAAGAKAHGPVGQGAYLRALGIEARHAGLVARATPAQKRELDTALYRLTDAAAMGESFRVLALTGPDDPVPAGFEA